ncbi:MAG: SpoIID/LytB domain-containing protein [Muribaculaceae bacterium]|nr:SpoIID/LytB domain-containing protein [Muribaculaceae bacterium]
MSKEPEIKVGILSASEIKIDLLGEYIAEGGNRTHGGQTFSISKDRKVVWNNHEYGQIEFRPAGEDVSFEVYDVTIGVNFHWERRETQRFKGAVRIIVEDDKLTLINILPVEDYLMSVISSEMSATASAEFLKAHAVISRSWLLAQIDKSKKCDSAVSCHRTDDELIKWYDRDDHVNFDVCADDHCQRYQGITRQTTETVAEVIRATKGAVLLDEDGKLCDTRFSKCCGGVFEEFENCWEPHHYHYLEATRDDLNETEFPDLTVEENAREWIMSRPQAFCNTSDSAILRQVLNNYDQETTDFYRWTVEYSQAELSALIRERSGMDFGDIMALEPVERGTSGRLVRLRIVGTLRTMTIGKELEIRRTLSKSHLYSSAFVVEYGPADSDGLPSSFRLYGAGWGHGVGLCQIGAAVMGANGYSYKQILSHYFKGAKLTTLY